MSNLTTKFFRLFLLTFLCGIISTFLIIFSILWYFSNDLPDYKSLAKYKPPISSRVYSSEGDLIAEYALQKRLFISYDSIPKVVINSFLSAEDQNFFDHPGIDARGILRAIITNLKNLFKEKRLEGASTITQQVAKNFLLTSEISFQRKIKEAILAFRIERAFTKQRIMELYLNQIYLGQGTYGIAAASLEYFDKSIADLNYEEAALLAALPKAPSKYDPYKSISKAKKRRDLIIKNIYKNGYVSEKQYKDLISKKIILKRRKINLLEEANFYSEEVRRNINEIYGYDDLYKGGLSIMTPLNSIYQKNAIISLREGLNSYDKRHGWRGPINNFNNKKSWRKISKKYLLDKDLNWKLSIIKNVTHFYLEVETYDKKNLKVFLVDNSWIRTESFEKKFKTGDLIYLKFTNKKKWVIKQLPKINGALVAMDPYTGRVLALVGGFSYGLSEFNRATQAKRQPGSAFKPFVYVTALENGYNPSTLILDAPFIMEQGEGKKLWKPQNYGKKFYGPSTIRKGLEKSRNLMTVRIAQDLGLSKIISTSKELDIYENVPENLSFSLGSMETTLLKLTNAYCTFVNGGKKVKPILIDRVQDRRGKTLFNADKRKCIGCNEISHTSDRIPTIKNNFKEVISAESAYQMVSMLEGVVKRGTGRKLKSLNLPLAGKTGTTNKNMDAWFIGFTSNIVIGVYVGFDEPASLGKYETGAKAALPIFKNFVQKTLSKSDTLPFKVPKGVTLIMVDSENGKVPNLSTKNIIYEAFKKEDSRNFLKFSFNKNDSNLKSSNETTKLYFY